MMGETKVEIAELDKLRQAYKDAVEQWIAAIRAQENLATPDHSVSAIDVWEHAGFDEEEAREKAMEARQAYEDALRQVDFNF
jgi:predicted RNase H-like HicB family nuclease